MDRDEWLKILSETALISVQSNDLLLLIAEYLIHLHRFARLPDSPDRVSGDGRTFYSNGGPGQLEFEAAESTELLSGVGRTLSFSIRIQLPSDAPPTAVSTTTSAWLAVGLKQTSDNKMWAITNGGDCLTPFGMQQLCAFDRFKWPKDKTEHAKWKSWTDGTTVTVRYDPIKPAIVYSVDGVECPAQQPTTTLVHDSIPFARSGKPVPTPDLTQLHPCVWTSTQGWALAVSFIDEAPMSGSAPASASVPSGVLST